MFETVTWVKPDKSFSQIMVKINQTGDDIEFETGYLIKIDDLIRRGHKPYRVYEVLGFGDEGNLPPFTVRCEPNKEGR
jgi:hypothetical protein